MGKNVSSDFESEYDAGLRCVPEMKAVHDARIGALGAGSAKARE